MTSQATDVRAEIEEFLFTEADLLDERRFDEWLDLLHPDVEYQMPLRRNVHSQDASREYTTAGQDILWYDEGKDTLTKRVRQLQTGEHWADEPISRVSHLVTNVRLLSGDDKSAEASCRFLMYRNRVDIESDILIGRRRDLLVREDVDLPWLLRRRLLFLDQSVLLAKNLTVFL
jgi:3-phenylpropionate/cinnamic acid dioxygenase small subunit